MTQRVLPHNHTDDIMDYHRVFHASLPETTKHDGTDGSVHVAVHETYRYVDMVCRSRPPTTNTVLLTTAQEI